MLSMDEHNLFDDATKKENGRLSFIQAIIIIPHRARDNSDRLHHYINYGLSNDMNDKCGSQGEHCSQDELFILVYSVINSSLYRMKLSTHNLTIVIYYIIMQIDKII